MIVDFKKYKNRFIRVIIITCDIGIYFYQRSVKIRLFLYGRSGFGI